MASWPIKTMLVLYWLIGLVLSASVIFLLLYAIQHTTGCGSPTGYNHFASSYILPNKLHIALASRRSSLPRWIRRFCTANCRLVSHKSSLQQQGINRNTACSLFSGSRSGGLMWGSKKKKMSFHKEYHSVLSTPLCRQVLLVSVNTACRIGVQS